MLGVGPWELILVFAIALLMFGGKRLPDIATGLGQAIRNFKTAMREGEMEDAKKLSDASHQDKPPLPPAATPS